MGNKGLTCGVFVNAADPRGSTNSNTTPAADLGSLQSQFIRNPASYRLLLMSCRRISPAQLSTDFSNDLSNSPRRFCCCQLHTHTSQVVCASLFNARVATLQPRIGSAQPIFLTLCGCLLLSLSVILSLQLIPLKKRCSFGRL